MLSSQTANSIVQFEPSYKALNDEYRSASTHALMAASRRELAETGWRNFDLKHVMENTNSSVTILDSNWSSIAELVVDSVIDIIEAPSVDTHLSLVEKMCRLVDPIADMARAGSGTALLRGMILAASDDPQAGVRLRNFLNTQFRKHLKQILAEAAAQKKIHKTYDVDLAMEILFGTLWHRVLVMRAPLSETAVTRAVTATLDHLQA